MKWHRYQLVLRGEESSHRSEPRWLRFRHEHDALWHAYRLNSKIGNGLRTVRWVVEPIS